MTLHDLFLVASGIIPEVVIDNDVDAEIDNEEAFIRKLKFTFLPQSLLSI